MAATSARGARGASSLAPLLSFSETGMALGVLLIIAMLIIPLPAALLDILITANLAGALLVLLVSLSTRQPLQFSAFPSVLLLATLFRLGLNVLSTRLILLQGNAGQVIAAFGSFVIGGNYVVGVVVFLILVVVQFVVITNGAGRVAEVAARFTLDAMPGKQVSIDADLNAGVIDEGEARRRRRAIEAEADFYGAMDGASKFVKGDAIAGIIIIVINSLGGFFIGVVQAGMSLQDALRHYTLLTVGDGLVSQIPALLISTATGIMVTRATSEEDLGRDVASQVLANPPALTMVALVLLALGLAPGLPKAPFFLMAAMLGGVAYALRTPTSSRENPQEAAPRSEPEGLARLLTVDPMELEIGFGLVSLADTDQPGNLLSRITHVRRQLALELGLVMPTVRIHDSMELGLNAYQIRLRGTVVAQGEVRADRLLGLHPGGADFPEDTIDGIPTAEPAFGLPALWIARADKERAELQGYTVVDPSSVVATHLTETVKSLAHEILSRQDVQSLLDNVKRDHPAVIDELIPRVLSLSDVHRVLQNLLQEQVSIRDLVTILEALAPAARVTTEPDVLAELVRQSLGRAICAKYAGEDSTLHVLMLDPELQEGLLQALQTRENQWLLEPDPDLGQRLIQNLGASMERLAERGFSPVLVVPGRLRLPLRHYLQATLPRLALLSYGEIPPGVRVSGEGTVAA
ncbi:MAG: flagellar biosynthesis protein FlhA [Chloroflexi bacterium]|nr:flagellar biosynthesis protein FlhA [Chloroflexota bacterium]